MWFTWAFSAVDGGMVRAAVAVTGEIFGVDEGGENTFWAGGAERSVPLGEGCAEVDVEAEIKRRRVVWEIRCDGRGMEGECSADREAERVPSFHI